MNKNVQNKGVKICEMKTIDLNSMTSMIIFINIFNAL